MQENTLKGPRDLAEIGAIKCLRNFGVPGGSKAVGDICIIPEDISLSDAWCLINIGKAEPYVDPDVKVPQEPNQDPPGISAELLEDIKDNFAILEDADFTEDGFPTAAAVNELLELTGDAQVTQEDINSTNELKKTED